MVPRFSLSVDEKALARDLDAVRAQARTSGAAEDLRHFRRLDLASRGMAIVGLFLAAIPNPISVLLLAAASFSRWTIIAHHASHRGVERLPGCPASLRGNKFAHGLRRLVDWLDWMHPAAWNQEHNVLHHYHLGEDKDPDVAEDNAFWLRDSGLPMWLRYVVVVVGSCVWKPFYYAPNTLNELLNKDAPKAERHGFFHWGLWSPRSPRFWAVVVRCWLPYSIWRFGVLPALFLPLGQGAVLAALVNLILAELLSNFWSFWVVVPNHTGGDLYRFPSPVRGRGDFYLRQILGSTNYACGGHVNDFMHGWLNYQVEHHLFPDLAPSQYQRIHPRVRAVCVAHGVPFTQESLWTRARRCADVLVGRASMQVYDGSVRSQRPEGEHEANTFTVLRPVFPGES